MNISQSSLNFSNMGSIQEAPVPEETEALLNPAFNTMPGATQLVFAPMAMRAAWNAAVKGIETNDSSGLIDSSARVIQNSSAFVNALLQITEFISFMGLKFSSSVSVFVKPLLLIGSLTTGLIVATIEAALETRGIFRTTRFMSTLQNNRETLGALETLRALKRDYLELSKQEQQDVSKAADKFNQTGTLHEKNQLIDRLTQKRLQGKQQQLIRCTQVKFAHHVVRELDSLIENLEQGHVNALDKANTFLDHAIIQADKGRLMHFVGLLVSGFIVAALIAVHFAVPVLPILYFTIAIALAVVRYGLYVELFESFEWQFSLSHCMQKGLVTPFKKAVQSVDKTIRNLWKKTKPHRDLWCTAVKQTMIPFFTFKAFYVELIKNLDHYRYGTLGANAGGSGGGG